MKAFVKGKCKSIFIWAAAELGSFLAAGPAPVYVGFGSMPGGESAEKAGQRGFQAKLDKNQALRHYGSITQPKWKITVATITVKNIPDDLYERLKESARANRRSINSEVIVSLERQLRSRKVDPETFLANARKLRELTADYIVTDDELNQAKGSGRP